MENHADVEKADAPEQSKNAAVPPSILIFFFQSVVAAALFPIVLERSGDTVVAVWRLSLLLCSYFYSAVCVLSSSSTREGKARLFLCLTYVAFMAFVVDTVLSHAVGTAIIYLDSVWMACVFGHALAGAIASSSSYEKAQHSASSQAVPEKLAGELFALAILLVVFAAIALAPVCIMDPAAAPEVVVAILPALLCFSLTVAIIFTLKPMQGTPGIIVILGVECERDTENVVILGVEFHTQNVLLCSFFLPLMLYICSLLLVGEVVAAVLPWICVVGLAVLLGYCISLHASSASWLLRVVVGEMEAGGAAGRVGQQS